MSRLLRDFVYNKERPSPWTGRRPGIITLGVYFVILAVSIWLVAR